jgi:ABC-type oligopeptide transport system substrate-binding subunit
VGQRTSFPFCSKPNVQRWNNPDYDALYDQLQASTTLEEAQASNAAADPEDLDAGCGQSGFPWSKATR